MKAGDYTATRRASKTGLIQGGEISPAFYRIYINEFSRRIRNRDIRDELDSLLWVKLVVDDVTLAAKLYAAMQAHLNEFSKWAKEDKA